MFNIQNKLTLVHQVCNNVSKARNHCTKIHVLTLWKGVFSANTCRLYHIKNTFDKTYLKLHITIWQYCEISEVNDYLLSF